MKKIRIAIIGASEIAYRRFLPALLKDKRFSYVGVAIEREQDVEKAQNFLKDFGGEIIQGYDTAIYRKDIDAIYVPQPPALHYKFGKKVLESGKHLFMEKPFTISLKDTIELINLAQNSNLAVVENYMFRFHKQISEFIKLAQIDKILGNIKEYELCFSFPQRSISDFRYNKSLGGGALFDCGGYTMMLADILLERKGELISYKPLHNDKFDVDIGGEAIFRYKDQKCNISFGMDNPYNCYAKAYGDKGILAAPRVFTAPCDFDVEFSIQDDKNNMINHLNIGKDDTFLKSIDNFYQCIQKIESRDNNYKLIIRQAEIIEKAIKIGGLM